MTAPREGLESALDGLLSGLDELLAHRPEPVASPSAEPLDARRPRAATGPPQDTTLHLLTALLHECPLSDGLREASLSQIRRMVSARAVDHPEGLSWRGPPQVSPRLMPWLRSLVGRPGLQVWASPEGEWLYVAQAVSLIQELACQSDPLLWRLRLCQGFPVAALAAMIPPRPQSGGEDDPHHVLRLPRLPEFCTLGRQGAVLVPDPDGEPCMARWLDAPLDDQPDLLGLAWPLLQALDQDLRLPVPVVGGSAHLG